MGNCLGLKVSSSELRRRKERQRLGTLEDNVSEINSNTSSSFYMTSSSRSNRLHLRSEINDNDSDFSVRGFNKSKCGRCDVEYVGSWELHLQECDRVLCSECLRFVKLNELESHEGWDISIYKILKIFICSFEKCLLDCLLM